MAAALLGCGIGTEEDDPLDMTYYFERDDDYQLMLRGYADYNKANEPEELFADLRQRLRNHQSAARLLNNGLSETENLELLRTENVTTAIALILRGLQIKLG